MTIENSTKNNIAIIGFACRFPGAGNAEQFWENLKGGVCSIVPVPESRWDKDAFYSIEPEEPFKTISRHGAFLDQVDFFDAKYFHIKEDRARCMDPQQRLVLETAADAIQHAGYTKTEISGTSTSVFLGAAQGDYEISQEFVSLDKKILVDGTVINSRNGFLGNTPNMIASIVSYYFNLNGTSLVLSSACSSSLVAIHLACQSILSGESKMSLAGGIQLYLSPKIFIAASKTGVLSSDGMCRTFSKDASGYTLAEGVGVCLLKHLEDAVRDGDFVYGIIRASAVNNDGKTMSLIMPNAHTQTDVILRALEAGKINADSISYFEANGTAMPIGDPLEVEAATTAYRKHTDSVGYCAIGSLEPNIGHAAHAAGIARLIKIVLSLFHKKIPPITGCEEVNPKINFADSPFYLNRELADWKPRHSCRLAAINALGFGGTNCHVVVEEFNPSHYPSYQIRRKPLGPIAWQKKRFTLKHESKEENIPDRVKKEVSIEPQGNFLEKIQNELKAEIAHLLNLQEKELDASEDIRDYSFDSLLILSLVNTIKIKYNIEFTSTEFLDSSTIHALSQNIEAKIRKKSQKIEKLETESIKTAQAATKQNDSELLLISAPNCFSLVSKIKEIQGYAMSKPSDLATFCYSISSIQDNCCLSLVVDSWEDLFSKLAKSLEKIEENARIYNLKGIYFGGKSPDRGKLAFLFPGYGSPYPRMLQDLRAFFPIVEETFLHFDNLWLKNGLNPITSCLCSSEKEAQDALAKISVAQGAILASELALYRLLISLGIKPDMVAGHSYGEFIAAHVAGIWDQRILEKIALRTAFEEEPSCTMATISASPERVEEVRKIATRPFFLANRNCQEQCVISGEKKNIAQALLLFQALEIAAETMPVSYAFHSPLAGIEQKNVQNLLQDDTVSLPEIPVYSCMNAEIYPQSLSEIRTCLIEQMTHTVFFDKMIQNMYKDGARIFMEVGPRNVLCNFTKQILSGKPHLALFSNHPLRSGLSQLYHLLAILAAYGIRFDYDKLYKERRLQKFHFPFTDRKV